MMVVLLMVGLLIHRNKQQTTLQLCSGKKKEKEKRLRPTPVHAGPIPAHKLTDLVPTFFTQLS